ASSQRKSVWRQGQCGNHRKDNADHEVLFGLEKGAYSWQHYSCLAAHWAAAPQCPWRPLRLLFKSIREISSTRHPGAGYGSHLGLCRYLEPGTGHLLRLWGLCHGHVSHAAVQWSGRVWRTYSGLHGLEPCHDSAIVLEALSVLPPGCVPGTRDPGRGSVYLWRLDLPPACQRHVFRHSHPGYGVRYLAYVQPERDEPRRHQWLDGF